MTAKIIVDNMAKSNSIYGYAARLCKDEEEAKAFILESFQQSVNHRQAFINCFGAQVYVDVQNYILKEKL